MKQSNWILGLGILVAALLIAGSFYLKATPVDSSQTNLSQPKAENPIGAIKSLTGKPLQGIIERVTTALLVK